MINWHQRLKRGQHSLAVTESVTESLTRRRSDSDSERLGLRRTPAAVTVTACAVLQDSISTSTIMTRRRRRLAPTDHLRGSA
eukprot:2060535-Rhodomonas_salina.1